MPAVMSSNKAPRRTSRKKSRCLPLKTARAEDPCGGVTAVSFMGRLACDLRFKLRSNGGEARLAQARHTARPDRATRSRAPRALPAKLRAFGEACQRPPEHDSPLESSAFSSRAHLPQGAARTPVSRIPGWRCPRREQFI